MLVMTRGAFVLLLIVGCLVALGFWLRRRGHVFLATACWTVATTLLTLLVLGASGLIGA